jgi:hypothetical protein
MSWLRDEGLLEPLRAKLSPQTAALLTRPPLPTAWIAAPQMDELYACIAGLRGEDAVRAMALDAVRRSLGTLLRPLLSMYMKLAGSTPRAIFAHMPALAALFIKGVAFEWTPTGPSSGELFIGYANAPPLALFHLWKGMLEFAFELCQTNGEIAFHVAPRGTAARFAILWSEQSDGTADATTVARPGA